MYGCYLTGFKNCELPGGFSQIQSRCYYHCRGSRHCRVGALPKQVYIEPAARADTFPALVFAHSVTWNTVKIISKSAIGNLKEKLPKNHPASRAFLSLAQFWHTQEKIEHEWIEIFVEHVLHVARIKFWTQSNNQEFGTAGSVITIGLSRQDKTRFISLSSVYMWQIEKKEKYKYIYISKE